MDISPISAINAVVQLRQERLTQEVQLTVLKKAMDLQASSALNLLQAMPGPLPLATSGPLGTQVNVMA